MPVSYYRGTRLVHYGHKVLRVFFAIVPEGLRVSPHMTEILSWTRACADRWRAREVRVDTAYAIFADLHSIALLQLDRFQ